MQPTTGFDVMTWVAAVTALGCSFTAFYMLLRKEGFFDWLDRAAGWSGGRIDAAKDSLRSRAAAFDAWLNRMEKLKAAARLGRPDSEPVPLERAEP